MESLIVNKNSMKIIFLSISFLLMSSCENKEKMIEMELKLKELELQQKE